MSTTTPFLGLTKPTVGGNPNTWGPLLNTDFDLIDTFAQSCLLKTGDTAAAQIGFFAGTLGAPGWCWAGDTGTGARRISAGKWSAVSNGVDVVDFDSTGLVALGLTGKVGSVLHMQLTPYQTDANNGGCDFLTRRGNVLTHAARMNESGYFGIGWGAGVMPKNFLDVNGGACANLVDLAGGSAINVLLGSHFKKTVTTNWVPTVSNVPTGRVSSFILKITNGGAFTVTWPASFKWPLGVPPALTVSGVDLLGFYTTDDGVTWNACRSQQNSS